MITPRSHFLLPVLFLRGSALGVYEREWKGIKSSLEDSSNLGFGVARKGDGGGVGGFWGRWVGDTGVMVAS